MSELEQRAIEERARRRAGAKEAMLDQLALLVDEAEALEALLGSMPGELIHSRPFDGSESIGEMLLGLARLDRGERQEVMAVFLPGDAARLRSDEPEPAEGQPLPVEQILRFVSEAREDLMRTVRAVADRAWESAVEVEGERLTPLVYLGRVVQHDAGVLRQIAERVYEARPVGSPGLTAQ